MTTTKTSESLDTPRRPAEAGRARLESKVHRCDWCQPSDLCRVHRRLYEWALRLLWLYPYVCRTCGVRGLMFGRYNAFNWRWRRVRIRIVFRMAPAGGH